MKNPPRLYSLGGKAPGANWGGLYPSGKGWREYFGGDSIAAIDIGMDGSTPFDTVPATLSAPREAWLLLLVSSLLGIVDRKHIPIEETGLAGVALFGDDHPDANRLRLVGEQVQKLRMGDLHKLLSMLFPQLHLLFPKRVLAKNERSNAFCNQQGKDPTPSGMRVLNHPPMALRLHPIRTIRAQPLSLS